MYGNLVLTYIKREFKAEMPIFQCSADQMKLRETFSIVLYELTLIWVLPDGRSDSPIWASKVCYNLDEAVFRQN